MKLLPFLGVVLLLALGMIYSTQAPRISEGGSDGVAPSWVAAHSKSTKGGNAHRASTSASAIELQQVIEVVASEHSTSSLGAFVPGHTTYRLRALLPPNARNVYAMFGDATHRPQVPAAWFSKFAMKHTAPPSSKIYSMPGFEDVALSSFLSLGPDEDDGKFNSGQVGAALSAWTEGERLSVGPNPGLTDDFSLFWMDPDQPDNFDGQPLIAQLTVPAGDSWYVKLGLQGRMSSKSQPDWQMPSVVWINDLNGANCPPGTSEADCLLAIGTGETGAA